MRAYRGNSLGVSQGPGERGAELVEYGSAIIARDLDRMQALHECIHAAGNEAPELVTLLAGGSVIGVHRRFLANLKSRFSLRSAERFRL
jgi:hypothetical protein